MAEKTFNIKFTETRFYEYTVPAASKEEAIELFDSRFCGNDHTAEFNGSRAETTEIAKGMLSDPLSVAIDMDEDMIEEVTE